jgi:proline dehydrogenase
MSLHIIMFIPIVNRFTCNKKQLTTIKQLLSQKNMRCIFDYTNENKENHSNNFREVMDLTSNYSNETIAVKLSALNVNNQNDVENYLDKIIQKSVQNNNTILIDAENYEIQDKINSITDNFMETYNKDQLHIYKTYQLYRTDYLDIMKHDLQKDRNYSIGFKIVRGAYYNEDKKHNVLFDHIDETHKNYNRGIEAFVNHYQHQDKLLCATHNKKSVVVAMQHIQQHQLKNIEFAQLMGMSDTLSGKVSKKHSVYKYIPYGNFNDTLPYLIRRLYENYPMIMNIFK